MQKNLVLLIHTNNEKNPKSKKSRKQLHCQLNKKKNDYYLGNVTKELNKSLGH